MDCEGFSVLSYCMPIGGLHCCHNGDRCTKQKKISSHNLHKNGIQLSEEKNRIVPVHQRGRHDVTCKPSILTNNHVFVFQLNLF